MDRDRLLTDGGYMIVAVYGAYCLAFRQGREMLLFWDGECWHLR